MSDLKWTDDLTKLAIKNQSYQSWAVINPNDMYRAIRIISEYGEEGYPASETEDLRTQIGTQHKDFLNQINNFGFVDIIEVGDEKFYALTKKGHKKYLFSGEHLAQENLTNEEVVRLIGHNFILIARDALEFCTELVKPGRSKEFLDQKFKDCLVFSNKLNPFKFDNLIQMLENLQIIKKEEFGYIINYSPAPLTFYCILERYLLEAEYDIGAKVHSGDLQNYTDRILPSKNLRSEMYDTIGLTNFPFEGWGKFRTWLTPDSFVEFLEIGLVHPVSLAKILCELTKSTPDNSERLQEILLDLKEDRIKKVERFRTTDEGTSVRNIDEVLNNYSCQN